MIRSSRGTRRKRRARRDDEDSNCGLDGALRGVSCKYSKRIDAVQFRGYLELVQISAAKRPMLAHIAISAFYRFCES